MTAGGGSAADAVVAEWEAREARRANRTRLDDCSGPHLFEKVEDASSRSTLDIFRCARCEGEVFSGMARWYDRGLRHGYALAKRGETAP